MDVRTCAMKLGFCPRLWYVDIIDQLCGMLERADRIIIGGCVSSMDGFLRAFGDDGQDLLESGRKGRKQAGWMPT